MQLNYKLQGNGQTIVFLHGVLGSLDNLNPLAKHLVNHYQTLQVDLRNHGLSPWSATMDFDAMTNDIVHLCHQLQLSNIIVIGHSMGGKVAMQLTQTAPELINQIIVLDIAPIHYINDANLAVFATLKNCIKRNVTDKAEISAIMQNAGIANPTIQFLLKSFKQQHWLFNFDAINHNYVKICDWQPISPWLIPTLFIRGDNSDYIIDEYYTDIIQQFPYAQIETVTGAGHNVHAEKPKQVLHLIESWLHT